MLGTVIGVGALVATLGLSKTAANQIVGHFDALAATDIVVSPSARAGGAGAAVLPWDAEARLLRLNGVAAAGTLSDVDVRGALVRSVPVNDPLAAGAIQLPMKAASPGLFRAVRADLATGRLFDAGHSRRADRVLVLGPNAARRLGIARVDQQPAIFIGDRLYAVIGLLAGVRRQASLLGAAIMPEGTARREFGLRAPAFAQVETRIGAVDLIARQAPVALSPSDPGLLKVAAPPDPRQLRGAVKNDLNALFLLLGGVSLLVGRDRDRQRHARLGARARRRDRAAPGARRGAPPHRGAVPAREHRDGPRRRRDRREPRDARDRRSVGDQDLDPRPGPLGPARRARCSAR